MLIRELIPEEQSAYDQLINHPLQSWAWGEARLASGNRIIRLGIFNNQKLTQAWLMTVHPIPFLKQCLLYCPKGPLPDEQFTQAVISEARNYPTAYIKIEPDITAPFKPEQVPTDIPLITPDSSLQQLGYRPSQPLFTPYNFIIDLTQDENRLLANMKPKTRYNLKLAQRNGIQISEDNSDAAFQAYLELMAETTTRQKFYAHSANYHRQIWQHMRGAGIAHLLTATYQRQVLTAWILFKWKNTLYYPYGASSRAYKELMPNYLMMWEAIRFGQQQGCINFDLWGTAGLSPLPTDHWYGFHHFKIGFGPNVVKYLGAYDLPINQSLYPLLTRLYDVRRWLLRLNSRFTSNSFT